jgi:glycosyltransferase involved in cell wall biosynthesis
MDRPVTVMLLLRRFDSNDGVASYCETLIRGLAARGDRVVIVSGPVSEIYGSAARHAAIKGIVLDWIVLDALAAITPKSGVLRRIAAVMREHKVDVISPQGLSLLPMAYFLSKLGRRPVVANYLPSMGGGAAHLVATRRSFKSRLGYRVSLAVFTPAWLIAMSKEILDFFVEDCGVSPGRVAHIVPGIDTDKFRPPTQAEAAASKASFQIPDDVLVCVLTARLSFNKGHDIVVDAIRSLRATNPDLRILCLFPGAGDQSDAIQAYAFRDAADSVAFRFLGFVAEETLRTVYWASDIGLLPSRFEGFGLAIAEAMSCGCVPIRTPAGGARDQIVDGLNGFVVPFNDPLALAERILCLWDPVRRAEMRANTIQVAQSKFSRASMVASTSDLYRRSASHAR